MFNVVLAACCLNGNSTEFLVRYQASVQHIHRAFKNTSANYKQVITDSCNIFNLCTSDLAWSASNWIENRDELTTFSAPPIPRSSYAGRWDTTVADLARTDQGKSQLNPGYFGVRKHGNELEVWTDLIGIGRCYYVKSSSFFAACNAIGPLIYFLSHPPEIDETAIRHMAAFGWYTGNSTPIKGVERVEPSTVLHVDTTTSRVTRRKYYIYDNLVYTRDNAPDYRLIGEELKTVCANASSMLQRTPTVFLSGGKDSRLTCAAWLASKSPANLITFGTLQEEATVARGLFDLALNSGTLIQNNQITHEVKVPQSKESKDSVAKRIQDAFAIWDGDFPAIRIAHDIPAKPPTTVSIGGGGGEIAQSIYYNAVDWVHKLANGYSPSDRILSSAKGKFLRPEMEEHALAGLKKLQDSASEIGITGAQFINYWYLKEKFRRWTGAGQGTNSVILFANPSFIRGAFDHSPQDKINVRPHRTLSDLFIPGWGTVPFYKGRGIDTKQKTLAGLRLWQQDGGDNAVAETLESEHAGEYWHTDEMKAIAKSKFADALDSTEAVFLKALVVTATYNHVRSLRSMHELMSSK